MNYLKLPNFENAHFKRNFLNKVFLEIRYPIILEWEESKPKELINSLRKTYPNYEQVKNFNFGVSNLTAEVNHCLRNRNNSEIVAIRPNSLVFETTKYNNFDTFKKSILELNKLSLPHLDTNFYTRVGLRYINAIPFKSDPTEIINEQLLDKKLLNVLGDLQDFNPKNIRTPEI